VPRKDTPIVAVVCGGVSAETEVSRISGREVAKALRATYARVVVLELDGRLTEALKDSHAEVVFPVLHGPPGEDGTFQGFLEILGLPYVGSGVRASAFAMDKVVAKGLFRRAGLPVARDLVVGREEDLDAVARKVHEVLGADVVVKPLSQGSALGVSFARTQSEIQAAIRKALDLDERVLIEERIEGKEITAGVLERNGFEALPVIEVRTPLGSWYDYEHRYTAGLSEHVIPADISEEQSRKVQEYAVAAHRMLGCRDLSRADFVVPEQGDPIILEVNALPGMTPTSLYPDAAKVAGLSFEQLVELLIERALARRG
jgi:D-alanine-D-alanine ligase